MLNEEIRSFFPFLTQEIRIEAFGKQGGRIAFDNAASSQIAAPTLEALVKGALNYANVHRSAYDAATSSGAAMEMAYNTAANLINAASWQEITFGMNTTHMINLVALGIRDQIRDGDNIVITELEHSSNAGPWVGLVNGLAKCMYPRGVELRLACFDMETGELDYDHLSSLVDEKTKIVCCTGASNFLGVRPDLQKIAGIAAQSGYVHPEGKKGSFFLVDGAQFLPGSPVDVQKIGCDFFAWSGHKMGVPLGIGGLYSKEGSLEGLDHVFHGGGMYADLDPNTEYWREHPWDYTAGTPPILSTIAYGQGIRFLINSGLGNLPPDTTLPYPERVEKTGRIISVERMLSRPTGDFPHRYQIPEELAHLWKEYLNNHPDEQMSSANGSEVRKTVETSMGNIKEHIRKITAVALDGLKNVPGVTIYGPLKAEKRGGLVAFTVKGMPAAQVGMKLAEHGIETRWGHHCAYFAHERYGIKADGSVRMSFYVYNTPEEVDYAVDVMGRISRAAGNC